MAKYIIKRDSQSKFFWILKSESNGEIIARSSESYEAKIGVENSIKLVQKHGSTTKIDDQTK